jgi:hypothetical protein
VGDEGHTYLIDVDVLARIHARKDSDKVYGGLVEMAKAGKLKTVRQTFDELKKFNPQYEKLRAHRDHFQVPTEHQFNNDTKALIEVLGNKADYLWPQTGGRNPDPADPWIVAVAAKHNYTVVTNESPHSPVRIPAACKLKEIACRCIRGPHFLYEVGLVEKIKPEHIDPHSFFADDEE